MRPCAALFLLATAGCYLSHRVHDGAADGGACSGGRCLDAHFVDLGRPDLAPGFDAGGLPVCEPGETEAQPCGSCGHATRTCLGDGTWGIVGACGDETERCGVDVMLLADATGSHSDVFRSSEAALTTNLIEPIERDADVRVGVSEFADYGYMGYGMPDPGHDVPFQGVLRPTHDVAAVGAAIGGITFYNGGDLPESEIAGLDVLSGGVPHPTAIPFVCGPGEVSGGCWRSGAVWRVIVVMTDAANHGLPDGFGGLVAPYGDLSPFGVPNPPTWTTVRRQLIADGTYVYWIVPDDDLAAPHDVTALTQARAIAVDLGESPAEAVISYDATTRDTSLAINGVRMAMTAHFGIHSGP